MAGLVQDIKLLGENLPWLRQLRRDGLAAFEKQGIPSAKTEAWKYTKPRDLNADDFEMNVLQKAGMTSLNCRLRPIGFTLTTVFLIRLKPSFHKEFRFFR